MKKYFLAAAALAALAALVAFPYFMGVRIESVYRSEITSLSMPGSFTVEVAEYKRGWFSSEAKVLLTLVVPDSAMSADPEVAQEVGKLTRFVVQDEIHHGPFPFAGKFVDESSPLVALAVVDSAFFFQEEPFLFAQFFGQSALVTARTTVGFGGGLRGRVVGQKLVYNAPDKSFSIDWKGFDGSYDYAAGRLIGKARGEGLDLGTQDNSFRLLGYSTDFNYQRDPTEIFVGSQTLKLDGANATFMGQSVGDMKNLIYTAKTEMEGSLLKGEGEASIESVNVAGALYGPGKVLMRLSKLDMPSYLRFNDSFQTAVRKFLESQVGQQEAPLPPDPFALLDDAGKKALGDLLKNSPEVEVPAVSMRTPDGEISGRMKVTYQGNKPAPTSVSSLAKGLVFEFELRVPEAMARKIAATEAREEALIQYLRNNPNAFPDAEEIDRMADKLATRTLRTVTDREILKREGDFYIMQGGMKDGRFSLNGREYHVPLD